MAAIVSIALVGCGETASSGGPQGAASSRQEPSTGESARPSSGETRSSGETEGPGSVSHAEDTQFCASHECIENFPNGHGEVVQCSDGEWSHSGGISDACSDHGGVKGEEENGGGEEGSGGEESGKGEESGGTTPSGAPGSEEEGAGSFSHAADAQFCSTHTCIANFPNGHGTVVECNDGEWSHSGGVSGACSDHGGENASSASSGGSSESEGTGAESGTSEPLETLDQYWSDIREHDFASAYGYLAPGAAGLSREQFLIGEEHAGIQNAQFSGTVTGNAGSTASVRVQSLVTHDKQFGCRSWTGSYGLTRESGKWLISRAAITPHSC